MQSLESLTREAQGLAGASEHSITWHSKGLSANETEVARQLQICNACRYCEGFCAVFPAMARRLQVDSKADINYLANLCHNCGACLHACQYAPPHEFAVNVPQAMAKVRLETYTDFAWPAAMGSLYKNNGLTLSLAAAFGLALFLLLTLMATGKLVHEPLAGNFYAVFPHNTLALMFGAVFGFAVLALGIGVRRFWKEITPGAASAVALGETTHNVLRLKYLDGGHGQGCNDEDDRFTLRRRRFHHLTFYGFMLCFAATSVATLYHYVLGLQAPYAYTSLPVILGTPLAPTRRRRTKANGSRVYRLAVYGQPYRPGPDDLARHQLHGTLAGDSPGRCHGVVFNLALRQVCTRHLSHRSLVEMVDRKTSA